ncbi:hypothetical protein HPB50_001612 [Hyalomma asiaticum]|uniref:Uncharacterized protein n=1 Tax=Hyalomma asiaticum TaxID=266040 RepID=A0ACB7RXG4_HYAAI|nr:hypothetical protein HPB50_001612 [Hyalomma asiaticum]
MAVPCPAANATPAAAGPEPAPQDEQLAGNPASAASLGPDSFFASEAETSYEDVPDTRSLFFIAWLFCCVGSIIIFFPLAFILMPLFSGGIARVKATVAAMEARPAEAAATAKSAKFIMPTWTVPPRATAAVPPSCSRVTPHLNENVNNINNNSFDSSKLDAIDTTQAEVYCIFNISRVRRSPGVDFLLYHFPWPICPNVIYWSISVNAEDGTIVTRSQELDAYSGFYNITSVARKYVPDTNVLFTIGGYPEDSGIFSLLGVGTLAEISVVQTMVVMLYRLHFNGLNIHLVEDVPCEQYFKNKMVGLQSFITELKKLVAINAPIENFKITLMVGTNTKIAKEAIAVLGNDVDRVFVDTFRLFANNFSSSFSDAVFCGHYLSFLTDFNTDMNMNSKICYSYSSLTRTWNLRMDDGGPPLAVTQTFGYASFQDLCSGNYAVDCDYGHVSTCKQSTIKVGGAVIAIANFFTTHLVRTTFKGRCLLLDSVDYGVHPKGCSLNMPSCDVLTVFSETYRKTP